MKSTFMRAALWLLTFSVVSCAAQTSDSSTSVQSEQAELYTRAVSEFLDAVKQKDNVHFDTLYIGKVYDFPDIALPESLNGTVIKLLQVEEADAQKQHYTATTPYINLIGFIEPEQADFIMVTFFPNFEHQFDGYISLKRNPDGSMERLGKRKIEVLAKSPDGKPTHYNVFEDGILTGTKPLK